MAGAWITGDAGFAVSLSGIVMVAVPFCVVVVVGLGCGDVLGPDQTLDQLHPALAADGDDAAGDGDVLGPEHGAALDRRVDLGKPGLDRLAFGSELPGPLVLVHVDELVVADVQALALGLLLVGGLAGRGVHAPEAGEVRPAHLDACLGPLPAGRELVRRRLEPVHGELVEEVRVLEPDAPLVLVGEEVAVHDTAGRLIGVHAHEEGDRGGGGDAVLGEHALDLPAARPVALVAHLLPHRHLARPVCGHGEGLEGLEVDRIGAVGVEDLGRGVAEAKPLLDDALRDPEAGGDIGDGGAVIGERAEGLHLVGRVHRHAHHVLRERELAVGGTVVDDPAGDGMVGFEHALGLARSRSASSRRAPAMTA